MSLVPATTQPLPPSGEATPFVPLSIESALTLEELANNIPNSYENAMMFPYGVLYTDLTVTSTYEPGASLGSLDVRNIFNGLQFLSVFGLSQINGFMPWNLITPFYSKVTRMEYLVRHIPVKVADCRVKLDVFFRFNGTTAPYATATYNSPNVHMELDDPSGQIDLYIPQVYVSNNVPTDKFLTQVSEVSPLVPQTRATYYVTTQYSPNALQPTSMRIVRVIYPTNNNTVGLAVKRTIEAANGNTMMLRPYFL